MLSLLSVIADVRNCVDVSARVEEIGVDGWDMGSTGEEIGNDMGNGAFAKDELAEKHGEIEEYVIADVYVDVSAGSDSGSSSARIANTPKLLPEYSPAKSSS